MKTFEYDLFPEGGEDLLEELLVQLVSYTNMNSETALFCELNQKFVSETNLVDSPNGKFQFINDAYNAIKYTQSKISKKEKLIQKMSKIEVVEKIISESEFKVGNFKWSIDFNGASTYEEKELLASCLENLDVFKEALDAGIISIHHSLRVNDQIDVCVDELNTVLEYKLKNGSVSYSDNDFSDVYIDDDTLRSIISEYLILQELGDDADYDEELEDFDEDDEDEEECSFAVNIEMYFVKEYYEELKSIAFRLQSINTYLNDNNIDVTDMNKNDYDVLLKAIHYYSLQDLMFSKEGNEDYFNEYEDLTIFYKIYLYNLSQVLINAAHNVENSKGKSKNGQKPVDFNDLTHKLLLELKKNKKKE